MLVVDASVSLAWVFPDEASRVAELALELVAGRGGLVPAVWPLEVGNVLLCAERAGRIASGDAARSLALFRSLPLRVVHSDGEIAASFGYVLPLARKHALSAYDAAYLEVALRAAAPLATLDEKLKRAARAEGVGLVTSG